MQNYRKRGYTNYPPIPEVHHASITPDYQRQEITPRDFILPPEKDVEDKSEVGIIKELRPDKPLERTEMKLRGYDWDSVNHKWVKKRKALMNSVGINRYMQVLSAVSEMVTFSYYKDESIAQRVEFVCDKIIPVLYIYYRDFGIRSLADLEILSVMLFFFTEASLRQSVGAGNRNVIRGTFREGMMMRGGYEDMPTEKAEKKGFFKRIFGR